MKKIFFTLTFMISLSAYSMTSIVVYEKSTGNVIAADMGESITIETLQAKTSVNISDTKNYRIEIRDVTTEQNEIKRKNLLRGKAVGNLDLLVEAIVEKEKGNPVPMQKLIQWYDSVKDGK